MSAKVKHQVTVSCGTKFHSDYTSYQLQQHGLLNEVITAHPRTKYLNRVKLEAKSVRFFPPIFALSYLFRKLISNNNVISKWLDYNLPVLFDKLAARSLKGSTVLLTWAWSGLESIHRIKRQGGIAIVEECGSCNQFQNELLTAEYEKLGLRFRSPTPSFIVKRQLEETKFADYLLCPSQHVVNSFVANGVDEKKCVVIPYGVNRGIFKPLWLEKKQFSIICVGTVGVRKGYIYMFKALELLKKEGLNISCVIIGKIEDQFLPFYKSYQSFFTHYDHVDHQELVNYYNKASLFVHASLDEGMALVQLEAMACGLPIICTTNSGSDAVVEDGIEGFIVPIRRPELIAEKIRLLYQHPELLKAMSVSAEKKAGIFTWDHYGNNLAKFIESI